MVKMKSLILRPKPLIVRAKPLIVRAKLFIDAIASLLSRLYLNKGFPRFL